MSYDYPSDYSSQGNSSQPIKLPAPCIVDVGIVVNKQDMLRILSDLGRVRYCYGQLEQPEIAPTAPEDEGYVLEVFAEPQRSTLVANHALYINVCSFDYLKLDRLPDQQPCFDLIQEHQRLRIVPLSNPLQEQKSRSLNTAALEAVVAEVLSASWDMRLDDDEFSF